MFLKKHKEHECTNYILYVRKRINSPLHGSTKQQYNSQLYIIKDDEWYVHVSSKISDDELFS